MPQGWPEKSIPSVLPITTPTPSKKNQGVNIKAADWRIAMMTKSCRPPETTKASYVGKANTHISPNHTPKQDSNIARSRLKSKTIQITFSEHAHVRLYQRATGTWACLLNGHSGLFEWSWAKVPAPKERYSIFWRERGAPKGTPFCLRTYWASVKRCRDISKWGEGLSRSSFMVSFCIPLHLG